MRKKVLLVIVFLFLILVITVLILKNWAKEPNQVCFKNYCFEVELAKTSEEINRGLMFREKLEQNKGMLFIFQEEEEYSFWMKNTLIPLDIIWINENKEIVFINENAQPCKEENLCSPINPGTKEKYVLEINGGTAEKIGLKIGDKIITKI